MKVIPELPPQSPDNPVIAEASKDAENVISLKSTLDADGVTPVLVIVIAVPITELLTIILFVAEFPFKLRAEVTVKLAIMSNVSVFTAVPVLVKVATVKLSLHVAVPEPLKIIVL